MHATHKKGGKKVLNLEARNKAIQLTWLKSYLNLGSDRATWTYFADAIIGTDIPDSHQIDRDPGIENHADPTNVADENNQIRPPHRPEGNVTAVPEHLVPLEFFFSL